MNKKYQVKCRLGQGDVERERERERQREREREILNKEDVQKRFTSTKKQKR